MGVRFVYFFEAIFFDTATGVKIAPVVVARSLSFREL
jgi:hypothetical protein